MDFNIEKIYINLARREVVADGNKCNLTYKEYELLRYLAVNKGIVLTRDKIMESVWGFDFQGESRTVDMHIKTLRQKLGQCGNIIQTVRNVGYKML
jgi:two-component system alkaline phosphatase synthesis response regulator PhoP